ncbi:MAG TPA: HD domain-containing phosphohydrolase [Burkholderiaceae bacterium]|nr:HD domain-containing phosphohydrolase [Burkholderiaceae bacterium]
MDQARIGLSNIIIGEPLRWDVYDADKKLLLRKGHLIESAHQVTGLIERGLYVDAHQLDDGASQRAEKAVERPSPPSVVRLINLASKRLERLLYNLHAESEVQGKFLDVVQVLSHAVTQNRDIALGCILLNQAGVNYAVRHCVDTATVAMLVMRTMHKTPAETALVMAAALTMNLGMLRYQDELENRQEPLTEKEIDLIRKHPEESADLLRQAGLDNADWIAYVLQHHENEDGSGYPLGTRVQGLSQNAKILALADRYCACITSRRYRKTLLPVVALRDVCMAGGKAGDPMLAAYFIKELGMHPPGVFVRLQNGEVGVVTGKGLNPNTPVVHALIGPRGAPLSFPIKRDTAKPLHAIRETVADDHTLLRFSLQQLWGNEASL